MAWKNALGVAMCVACLLVIIACAVMIFVSNGTRMKKYEYLETELLDLEYGIAGIVETKKGEFCEYL